MQAMDNNDKKETRSQDMNKQTRDEFLKAAYQHLFGHAPAHTETSRVKVA